MESVITVGLDGSPESLAAAHWAADEAARRRLALRLLHAWPMLRTEADGAPAEDDQNYWAKRIVHNARAELRTHHPHVPIEGDLVAEDAREALLRAASESEMLALGSRGLELVESYFLGDISASVVARAEAPVVLVRARERGERGERAERSGSASAPERAGGVVVALKLRGPCEGLLGFAFRAAAARGVPLRAVHGRGLPVQAYVPWGVDPDVADEVRQEVRERLDDALRGWRERYPEVTVADVTRLESPAKAVVRAAEGAELLVVGRRQHRHALTPRLGSVTQAAIHHAQCPVAVVPHD